MEEKSKENAYNAYLIETYPVEKRYESILKQMQDILEAMGILEYVTINTSLLGKAILDYFEDVDKLKKYEGIEKINVDKIYSYETFWLLRRKPIQIICGDALTADGDQNLYINENVFISIMIAKMLKEKDIQGDDCGDCLLYFMELVRYNFKYRIYTQKSLEMAVSAFFCGCDMYKAKFSN